MRRGWWSILKGTWTQMSEDNVSILAAGVAFYALMSLFPLLSAVVSLYGLVADPREIERQLTATEGILPPEAVRLILDRLQAMTQGPTRLGFGLLVSIAVALWSARAGTGMLMSALNRALGERETRNFIWFNLTALALTLGLALFGVVAILTVAIVPALLAWLPLPEEISDLLSFVRWPVIAFLFLLAFTALYRFAPCCSRPRWRWLSWGTTVATLVWLVGSGLFSLYVARFGSYDKTYGALGAVVVLMMWLYLTAYVILAGAELDAQIEKPAESVADADGTK